MNLNGAANAIRTGRPPFLDVYRGVAMSIVGILAYRSALNDSASLEVPDFRDRKARGRYRNDHWNPDPARRTKDMPWPSVKGDVKIPPKSLAYARKIWRKEGYKG